MQVESASAQLEQANELQAQLEAAAASDRAWLAGKESELQEALRQRQELADACDVADASARQLQQQLKHEQAERKAVVVEIEQRYQLVAMAKVRTSLCLAAASTPTETCHTMT
jgi:hypothetical protein